MQTCPKCHRAATADVKDGCTPYTCMTPCALCGHIGDVHRDWYDPGFCRKCRANEASHLHDFVPVQPSPTLAP